jgi:hypothetical protein
MTPRILVVVFLLALASGLWAQEVIETNRMMPSAPVLVNSSNLSSNDLSSAMDSPVRPRITRGSSQYIVSPTWSSEGATACFEVVMYQRTTTAGGTNTNTFATISCIQTLTADTSPSQTAGGRYPSTTGFLLAPTLGCQVADVRVVNISAGNVNWTAWPLGLNAQPSTALNE